MASTIKLKNGSGAPLAGDLVQAEPALDLTNKRLYTEDSGGNVIEVGTNPTSVTTGNITSSGTVSVDTIAEKTAANGVVVDGVTLKDGGITVTADVAFGDSDKATFGASDDLQIFHTGAYSVIADVGTGALRIAGTNLELRNGDSSKFYITAADGGAVTAYYDNASKLATTSTGIDVTGTVVSDGLTSSGGIETSGNVNTASSGGIKLKTGLIASSISNATDAFVGVHNSGGIGSLAGDLLLVPRSSTGVANSVQLFSGQTTPKLRQKIADNGDISFYEDTGTTAKFFWDASAESLGIGTTSPSSPIHIVGASSANLTSLYNSGGGIRIHGGTTGSGNYTGAVTFAAATGTAGLAGVQDTSDADQLGLAFFTHSLVSGVAASEEAMRISSSGNVGIGTTSPSFALDVDAVSAEFAARFTGTTTGYIRVNNDTGYADLGSTGNNMLLRTGGVERARIDSSGNLLIGKTSTSIATEGAQFGGGQHYLTTSGDAPIKLNRLTSDGVIAQFRKDGTTVGSIGTKNGIQYIAGASKGLRFDSTQLIPTDSTGTNSDASFDLGNSGVRFKNLYLSGGVYLGGTGAANKLDDYEEGNWTPVISDASTGGNTATYTNNFCTYTKVGRAVHLHINVSAINTTGMTAGNVLYIQNLPFVSVSTNRYIGTTQLNGVSITGVASSNIAGGQAYMRIHDTGTGSDILVSAITSGAGLIYADITYFTT